MPDYFYRFRPVSALLDGFHELENQEIYFPTLNELNDPLEGFKDIIWRGDRIVWRNLFRHYLLCLMQSVFLMGVMGEKFTPETVVNLVYQTDGDLPEAPIRTIYARTCDTFFSREAAEALLGALSRAGKSVRRDELTYYLSLIHSVGLTTIIELAEEHGIKMMRSMIDGKALAAKIIEKLPEILRLHSFADDQAEVLFFINNNLLYQLSLIHEVNNQVPEDRRSWLFIARDFPSYYVAALERLLYPDWHAACFVTDPTSASMWGHYGEGHRGMCLKFRARPNSAGAASLNLNRATSWRDDGSIGYSYVPHAFEAIEYTSEFPQIDFFESLGRLPIPKLSRFWYAGPNGERTEIGARVLRGDAQWRDEYWQRFAASYRTKSPHWSYENEHRIILYSNLDTLESKESRKLKYQFEDLAGIVFGLKTSMENKTAVMRIIERKSVESGRTDFEFWQAHYSHRTRQIELAQLRLLRISLGESRPDDGPPVT